MRILCIGARWRPDRLSSAFMLMILIPLSAGTAMPATLPAPPTRIPSSVPSADQTCRKLQLTGEIEAGHEWSASIGQGWTFRIVPIPPSGRSYTGWDLVVDAPGLTGYPDALLLGTPPYGSLNEREIGTTFGLRAQDAIAWEPRRFHFLATSQSVARARELYRQVMVPAPSSTATSALLGLVSGGPGNALGSGQLKIVDARLSTGTADPAPYARQWTPHFHQVPHSILQTDPQFAAEATPRGRLQWIRFEITLSLPANWKAPGATPAPCVQ